MKYFQMHGSIDHEMVDRFIPFYNQFKEDDVTIVLNTGGGGYFHAELLVKMINEMPKSTLFIQSAYSAGFMILFYAKCKIKLSKTCRGMWHYGKWAVDMNDKGKPYYNEDVCVLSNMASHSRESRRIAKKTMNVKEYTRFIKDADIYFNTARMKQIFSK